MKLTIREADLDADRGAVISTLLRCITHSSDDCRYNWLYLSNHEGRVKSWLAIDEDSGRVIGTAAAFPRRFYYGEHEIFAWVFGDLCLDSEYRSLGPALQLQRACLGVLKENRGLFCYDFPSASMVAVYQRLGFPLTARMLRLAKLLRIDRKVREIVRFPPVERAFSLFGNTLLKIMSTIPLPDASVELSVHHGRCGKEFSILDREQQSLLGIRSQRSAEYLNWRYVDNPLATYEIITARRHGELKGYAVCLQSGEDASVVDLFGVSDPAIVKGLLTEIVAWLSKRGVMTLSVWLNDSHPWLSWYTDIGFRVRDWAPIVCVPSPAFANVVDLRATKWFLMQGDRDS